MIYKTIITNKIEELDKKNIVEQHIRLKRNNRPDRFYRSGIFAAKKIGKHWVLTRDTKNGSFTIVSNKLESLDEVRAAISEFDYLDGYNKCACGGAGCFLCNKKGFRINN